MTGMEPETLWSPGGHSNPLGHAGQGPTDDLDESSGEAGPTPVERESR